MFYDYDWMLSRARSKLPKEAGTDIKFEVPKADVLVEGSKTIIRNFVEVCQTLNRKPEHLIKYLTRELGAPGNFVSNRLFFTGKFAYAQVNKRIDDYVKEFVICKTCGRHETEIGKEDRINVLICKACGARNPIRAVQ